MCGIAGIASFSELRDPDRDSVRAMVATLRHRGPDEEGVDVRRGVALGISRLSIIDVEGGSQPISNEDGSVRVVFNGEIYNYRALREELLVRGHMFATRSDTEVLVHAYEEYGLDFVGHLNGMFAIALHDAPRKRVVLARDALGIKPLYFCLRHDSVIWGSEIKAILAAGGIERELDVDALADFISWEYVPSPSTLFRSISKLEPATLLDVNLARGTAEARRYWHLAPDSDVAPLADREWEELVDHQLRQSVRAQMVSDVPLGAFLSGGVDSSLVVASMDAGPTFSIGFDDPSYNELAFSRKVAEHLRVPHVQETIRPDAAELFHTLARYLDDPIGDFSIFPTYLVSRLARNHVKVILSGDGGDELFGGYETYSANHVAAGYEWVPSSVRRQVIEPIITSLKPRNVKKGVVNKSRRFIEGMAHPPRLGHARWRLFAGEGLLESLLTPEVLSRRTAPASRHIDALFEEAAGFSPVNQCLYVDLKSYLSDNILVKVDRMSMAASLEARVPYLDTDLVEMAFRMPDRLKVKSGRTKILLKRLAARHLPRECVYRSKQGFSIPMKRWLQTEFRPLVDEYLNDKLLRQQGIFRCDTVSRLRSEHLRGEANHSHLLWSMIVFQAWNARWYAGSHIV